jgi:hypothetical protein
LGIKGLVVVVVIQMVKCNSKSQQRQQFLNGGSVCMKTLMACVELGRTLSHMVNPDAFLFKATKASETKHLSKTKKISKCKKREVFD